VDTKFYSEFFEALVNDCSEAAKIWGQEQTPYSRRAYVKTVFSFIDGNTYRLNQLWLDSHNEGYFLLQQKQIDQLREYKVNELGKKTVLKMTFFDSVKLSFSIPMKVLNIESSLNTNCEDWQRFRRVVDIRNRLTHPKSVSDLEVTLDEMKLVEVAADFYRKATISLMRRLTKTNA